MDVSRTSLRVFTTRDKRETPDLKFTLIEFSSSIASTSDSIKKVATTKRLNDRIDALRQNLRHTNLRLLSCECNLFRWSNLLVVHLECGRRLEMWKAYQVEEMMIRFPVCFSDRDLLDTFMLRVVWLLNGSAVDLNAPRRRSPNVGWFHQVCNSLDFSKQIKIIFVVKTLEDNILQFINQPPSSTTMITKLKSQFF